MAVMFCPLPMMTRRTLRSVRSLGTSPLGTNAALSPAVYSSNLRDIPSHAGDNRDVTRSPPPPPPRGVDVGKQ